MFETFLNILYMSFLIWTYDVIHGTKVSSGKDLLIVEEGPMVRSRTKRVKEVMGLFVQVMVDETLFMASKSTCVSLDEDTKWINLIHAIDGGATWLYCNHIVQ